jgi:pimeloyl-ACP methyl ester carboxylesterase
MPLTLKALAATGAALLGALALGGAAQADTSCLPGAQCGTVTVPLDRTNPSAGTTDIAYALLPRTDASRPRLGTIAPNPGGPGDSTIANAGLYTTALAPLRTRRDLLLIDPRGTGQSGALSCPSVDAHDPLTLDQTLLGKLCARDLGPRASLYGTAAAADDIDAVRAALGVDKLDLWGDSYGTFLMPVYAARHPRHVRSIVLDGAFPIASDQWGRDILRGVRRVIGLVCRRTHRCSGPHVVAQVGRLARRLRHHPVTFTATTPIGPVPLTLGERELASIVFGGGHPEVYGLLPAAVDAALDHDLAPLERLATVARVNQVEGFFVDPALFSNAVGAAASCKDYPRPYDLAASPAVRRAQYHHALAALAPGTFRPFSADAWLHTGIDAGPKCLDWPADPTAGSPLRGHAIPDVPVLVQSGDLDTNTPVEQGRKAAAQFAHPIYAVVANAGHTPDLTRCGQLMAIDFIKHLHTDPNRCAHAGTPPTVVDRPAVRAADLGASPVRRAINVALATLSDARTAAAFSGGTGTIDALRGGTYVVSERKVRFVDAQVVTDAVANGTQKIHGQTSRSQLRLGGHGVLRSRLIVRSKGTITRITGTVGGHRVSVAM